MKKNILFALLASILMLGNSKAQLILGDVNKPVNQIYPLGAANYGPNVPTFVVTPPTACGASDGTVRITWSGGTTASSVRLFGLHNCMNFSGNLVYNNPGPPFTPGDLTLNTGNAFTQTYTGLQSGIYTFGVYRDPFDENFNTNVNFTNGDDYAIGNYFVVGGDQTRCAVVGLTLLPVTATNNLTTCSIVTNNATNCTTNDGSAVISGLTANTQYEIAFLVSGVFSYNNNSGFSGTITLANLLTGIYPIKIRRQGETCFRQFNVKVGNNSGVECFSDDQLIDPSLGTTLVSNGDFGVASATLPTNGSTDYTPVAWSAGDPGDSKYTLEDTTDHPANGIATAGLYTYRLRSNWSFATQNRHLYTAIQITGDHTGSNNQNNGTTGANTGYMMVVNANYRTDKVLNISNINITQGRSYIFSFWGKNLQAFMPKNKNNGTLLQTYQPIIPRLALAVNGIIYDFADMSASLEPTTYIASTILNNQPWEFYNLKFVAPATVSNSDITIYNFQQGGFGNDFAIDDVQLLALSVIGNRVWNDLNRNGLQDLNEPGMANVTATLLDANSIPLQTTVSDAFGYYNFANVAPAAGGTTYRVMFTQPAGYIYTILTGGGGSGNATDSDPDPITGISAPFTMFPNDTEIDIDCGLVFDQPLLPSSIADLVYYDTNADGIQNSNETGLANVTVKLYNSAGTIVIASTVTNANGLYRFDSIPTGSYRIGVTLIPGLIITLKDQGGNDNTDSDANNTGVFKTVTDIIAVGINQQITNVDIGLTKMALTSSSFGDYCWNDLNQDGLQAANEPGLAGVKCILFDPGVDGIINNADDSRIDSMFTDAFGKYQFTNLTGSKYYVQFVPPTGYSFTLQNQGSNESIDSDITGPGGFSGNININNSPYGFNYEILDAGFFITLPVANAGTIGNFFWNDINGDGVQQVGEFGVPGISVDLLNSSGVKVATTTTDLTGYYIFTNVAPANYFIKFYNIPPAFQITLKDQGGDDNLDSDIDVATGITSIFILAANQNITNIDAGIRQNLYSGNCTVGSYVWYDFDNDGIQDIDETGVPNIAVRLRAAGADALMGTLDDVTYNRVTNSLGQFMFNGLPQGQYRVEFLGLPVTLTLSPKDAGANDNLDSDGNIIIATNSTTDNFRLIQGEDKVNVALGLVPVVALNRLGNRVWRDNNGNGIQEGSETAGVQSVVIQLLNAAGTLIDSDVVAAGVQPYQTVSNAAGYWNLVGIPNGTYRPRFSFLPDGFKISPNKAPLGTNLTDSDAELNGRSSITATLTSSTDLNFDLGLVPQCSTVGDYIWDDLNGDGIQDATEPAISGTTATIYNAANVALGSAVSNSNGNYLFPNVPNGNYYLRFINYPIGMQFTLPEGTPYVTNGSNVNPNTQRTLTYNFNTFGDTLHIDAGLRVVNTANVGNYVWIDANNNGIQNAGEMPYAGAIITLVNAGVDGIPGNGDDFTIGTTVSDGNGYYQFIITPTGNNYFLQFSNIPPTANFTGANIGSGSNDSRPNGSGITSTFNLSFGATNQNQDAGIISVSILNLRFENFTADKVNDGVLLNWRLQNDNGVTKYEIQYSTDGNNFSKLNTIANNNITANYNYTHTNPKNGFNYYRIVAYDLFNQPFYTEVKSVKYQNEFKANIYPNPASNVLYLSTNITNYKNYDYTIFDINGKKVINNILTESATSKGIDISKLTTGTYVMLVTNNNNIIYKQSFLVSQK